MVRRDIHPFEVAARCSAGFPTVIECAPVSKTEVSPSGDGNVGREGATRRPRVFTTLYWLTCPEMVRHIARYESAGWIGRLEDAVAETPAAAETLNDLHGEYAFRRRRQVGHARLMRLRKTQPQLAESLDGTGIAGVADPGRIKCLHAHAAYHMVRGGHPFFESYPELLKNVDDCRMCERLMHPAEGGRPPRAAAPRGSPPVHEY